jgi:hypothetical protein
MPELLLLMIYTSLRKRFQPKECLVLPTQFHTNLRIIGLEI